MVAMDKLLLDALSQSNSPEELQQAIAALEEHLARCTKQITHTQTSSQCMYPVIKSVLVKMAKVTGEASMDQLLRLADACFSQCHNCCGDESHLVLMYSYMKRLTASNRITAALSRGQQLLSILDSLDPVNSSSPRKDLLLGAGLNVLMCHCKLPGHIIVELKSINTAACAMLQALWQASDQAAVQHGDAMCDVLLQLNSLVGKEISCSSGNNNSSSSSASQDLCMGIIALQQQLLEAVSMSSKAGMLPKLAVEAAAALPETLRHCSIVSILAAARRRGSSSSSNAGASTHVSSVSLALLGMQAVLQSIASQKSAAAACVRGLVGFKHQEQQMGLETSLLAGLMYCCNSNLDLQCHEVNSIIAQIQSAVATVQLQTSASAAAGSNTAYGSAAATAEAKIHPSELDARALDTLTNKVANISLSGAKASRSSSRSSGSSNRAVKKGRAEKAREVTACSNSSGGPSGGAEHMGVQLQADVAAFQIELAVWCLQQLMDAGAPDDMQLAPLFMTYVTGVISIITALHSSSCYVQPSGSTVSWGIVARAAAMAAGMLKQLPSSDAQQGSASTGRIEQSSNSDSTGGQLHQASTPPQLLQQFTAAVQLLIGLSDHCEEPSADLHSGSSCSSSGSRLSSKELQWLSWQLYSCALEKDTASNEADSSGMNSSSNHRTASPSVVAHLLLLAWQCTKVQVCPQGDHACSGSTPAQCCPLEATTSPAAVLTLLQQAYAYFNCILSSSAACSAADADASATMNLKQAQGAPVKFQHGSSVQLVALQTVSVALQHSTAATAQHQAEAEQLQLRLHKVLKMYSRLRCMVAAVAEPSSSGSSNKAGRSGTGSRRQRATVQQQQQQGVEHPQASGEWLLQSAVQLLLQQQQQQQQQQGHSSPPSSSSSSTIQETIPVMYLAWLESKALLSIAEDSRCPGRHVEAAAVQELLDQLCSCHGPSGCDAVVLQASTKLLQGMVLCSGHDAFDSAGAGSKEGHSKGVSSSSAALSALSESCQNWSSLLLHLHKSGGCGSTSAGIAPKRSSRGAVKGRAETARSKSSDDRSSKSEVVARLDPVGIAQAFATELGADAAAGVLMLAGLSHCLLALLQANAAAKQTGSIHVANSATAAAGECLEQQEPQDGVDPEWVCSTDHAAAGTAEATRAATSNPGELYASACKLLHTCADLFTAMQHAACASSCSSNPLGVCSCFAPEAAVLALQAWHVAGLQGWSSCQAALGEAEALLTRALPAQLQAELQHMQQLVMPLGSDCGMTWLGLLLAPQHLPPSPVSDSSGCCSSSRDGSGSAAGADSFAASSGHLQTAAKMPKPSTAAMAAAPAIAPACNCACYCGCQLQSGRQVIAAVQQSHFHIVNMHAGARDTLQLQRALLLLAACHAASALGDVTAALMCAEQAVDLCRGLIAAAGSASSSSSGRLQSDAVLSCIRPLQPSRSSLVPGFAVSLYMSALWQLSEVMEVSGNPTDALRALKQLLKLSAASSCSCFTALALLKISAIYLRTGDDDNAVATAAVAAEHVQQFQQQQKLVPAHHLQPQQWQQSVLSVYVAAAGLQAEAGCNLVSGQHDAAQQQLTAAIQLLDQSVAAATHGKQQQVVCMMLWRAVDLRAKLQLQLAHSLLITEGHATAVCQLRQALEHLEAASTCSRCNSTAWPAAHAALQLQLLAWCCPDRPASQPSSTILQLIGFGSSSSHCDLQAEFACAAAEEDTAYHGETAAAGVQAAASLKARKTSRAASRASDKTSRGSGSSSGSRRNGKACEKSQLAPSDAAAVHPATWMSRLLMLLPACVGQPMLLHDACCILRSFLLAHGVLQGAALMLQLSLGVSITQQQLLAACRKLSQAQSAEQLQPACAAEAAGEAPTDGCQDKMSCGVWQQVQQQLNLQPLLADIASIARKGSGPGSNTNGRAGATRPAGSSSQLLLDMFSKVDSIATRWLALQRDGLLPCTAVCSLTAVGADASTPFGATAVEGGWYPLVTPAAAALAAPAPAASSSLLVCRMLPAVAAATDAVAGVQLNMLPLLVVLQPCTRSDDGCSVALQQALAEFSSILSESSASMQHSVKCTTAAQKATWWKQRVALDARMGALLQQLDEQWLGPWRCLLMQPGLEQVEAAAAAAASTFVADYFEFIFEEQPRQLLAQLVAVLLVHLDAVRPSERQQAVRDLCQLTQQRADGLHLSKLLSGLEDAHAAVAAAAAAAAPKQPRQLNAESPAASPPRQDGSSSVEAAIASDMPAAAAVTTAAAAVYVTPAAPKARSRLGGLRQGTASAKKPQSRLKAMQQGSRGAASTAADAVTEAGVSSLADMLSDKLQVGEFNKHDACDAAAAAVCSGRLANSAAAVMDESSADAASQPQQRRRQLKHAAGHEGRRVRFAADQGQENENPAAAEKAALDEAGISGTVAVPPSLARHAARRSRLAVMHATPTAAPQQLAAGDTSTSCMSFKVHAHAATASSDIRNASCADNTCTPAKVKSVGAAATGTSAPLQQQQHWVPSVLLLLDNQLQQLPWESLPGLKQQNMYRCPSLPLAAAIATRHTAAQHARCSHTNSSSSSSSSSSSRPSTADSLVKQQQQQQALCHVRLHDGYFLLNPDGDLQATQDTFEGWLQQLGLQGVSGSCPAAAHLKSALLSHELFLYFGHGAGAQYVPLTALKQLDRCAAAVLMGCSSGRLKQLGLYEPSGAMWGYLLAGCPAAVANLWDVTDRDIDRFAQALIQNWTDSSSSSDGSNNASGSNDGADLHATGRRSSCRSPCHGYAQQKTSQSLEEDVTPGSDGLLAKQPAASSGMSAAVAASRQACRLPSLIGAAAVCYGLPAYVDA